MKIIVDTAIWSLALRRQQPRNIQHIELLQALISDGLVVLPGVIRQEILAGIRHIEQYHRLRTYLRAFPNLNLVMEDYELAAEFFNTCRGKGIQGSNTDFLICAIAARRDYKIFTTDKDFINFGQCIPVELLSTQVGTDQ